MKTVNRLGASVTWRFLLLLAIPDLASAQSDLQVIVGPPVDAGATPDAPPLPIVAARPVAFGGVNATICDISVDTLTVKFPSLSDEDLAYKVRYIEPNFWYGMEASLPVGGTASFYVSTYEDAPGICFIAGRLSSVVAGINIVFRTHPDGTVWAEIVTNEELAESKEYYPDYQGQEIAATDEVTLGAAGPDSGQVIDVLVPYTQEAMCIEAIQAPICDITLKENHVPILNRINLLLMQSKMIFMNTGLVMSLQLVHSYLVTDYIETGIGNFDAEFEAMFTPGDGMFEGLQDLRDEYCADIVHLLVSQPWDLQNGRILRGRVSGIGPDMNNYALFSAIDADSVSVDVWTHETGHMLVSPSTSNVFTSLLAQKGMTSNFLPFYY